MTSDEHPTRSVVVFLGPSLDRERARSLLEADYRPPAQMGDIYRLVASGVSRIVLLDGLFHSVPEVWPREILEALSAGIHVIGASSMGALRAAELHQFGMTGIGTIFEWYRDGRIDGDDEVAIAHAEADEGFRALSEPLVNIRYNLQEAVARGDLSAEQAHELIEVAQQTPFRARSYRRLLHHDVLSRLPEPHDTLRATLEAQAVNLKQKDAMHALRYTWALAKQDSPPTYRVPAPSRFYLATSKRKRGFVHPRGDVVSGEMIWDAIHEDNALVQRHRDQAALQFYLQLLAQHWQLECPQVYLRAFHKQWRACHGILDTTAWLLANGLTSDELHSLVQQRATTAWMIEQELPSFDLDSSMCATLMTAWASLGEDWQAPGIHERCLLAVWARIRGITCPAHEVDRALHRIEMASTAGRGLSGVVPPAEWRSVAEELACGPWLIQKQPYYFGYTAWSPITAVLEELQVTGEAAQIVARYL